MEEDCSSRPAQGRAHLKGKKKLGMVAGAYHPSNRKYKIGDRCLGQHRQKARPYLQNNQNKKARDMVQAVELVPSKIEVLSSNPRTTKKKKFSILGCLYCLSREITVVIS
jgi:hypothetical protein